MKNKIVSILALFACFFLVLPEKISAEPGSKFTIHVVGEFGRKSRDCKGFGICYIEITYEYSFSFRLRNDNGNLIMDVPEEMIKEHEELFSGEVFLMEEDLKLPEEIVEKLELEAEAFIRRGKYPLEHTEKGASIYFNKK
ncbi:MAG: hypothetical protein DWQ44_01365 [Bacteroidetes bacterium]|nr:MAG: hypothetical protein DWQ33_00830 [Bacteroidota bacterium]REK04934.1 MAG: hypothetical protein DWQ39_06890 [Bacteroidota bacterium]REK36562.1 MAG: hypothetical protein DWQ44_01365 [Bacteroidota bacterium]REK50928.1 MAG: hypothetical protein DWQ48_02225 [Bacteroidota bacterium]